jgi:hypothetical protein
MKLVGASTYFLPFVKSLQPDTRKTGIILSNLRVNLPWGFPWILANEVKLYQQILSSLYTAMDHLTSPLLPCQRHFQRSKAEAP